MTFPALQSSICLRDAHPVSRIPLFRPALALTFLPGFSASPLADLVIPCVFSFSRTMA